MKSDRDYLRTLILHLNDDELSDLHDVIDDLIRDRYEEKSSDILDRIYS